MYKSLYIIELFELDNLHRLFVLLIPNSYIAISCYDGESHLVSLGKVHLSIIMFYFRLNSTGSNYFFYEFVITLLCLSKIDIAGELRQFSIRYQNPVK